MDLKTDIPQVLCLVVETKGQPSSAHLLAAQPAPKEAPLAGLKQKLLPHSLLSYVFSLQLQGRGWRSCSFHEQPALPGADAYIPI